MAYLEIAEFVLIFLTPSWYLAGMDWKETENAIPHPPYLAVGSLLLELQLFKTGSHCDVLQPLQTGLAVRPLVYTKGVVASILCYI